MSLSLSFVRLVPKRAGSYTYILLSGHIFSVCLLPVSMVFLNTSIYTVCFFFIELKVIVNLTYLYLSEIKKQGLIFSVRMGHLIICQKKFRSRQRIFILTGFSTLCMQSVCRVMNGQKVLKLLNLTLFFRSKFFLQIIK